MDNSIQIFTSEEELLQLESSVRDSIQKTILDRSLQGPINPKRDLTVLNYDGCIFSRKYLDLVTLILLCWYSELLGDFKAYLLYEVSLYLEKNLLFPELSAMTKTKEVSLLVLLNFSQKVGTRVLFGTVLNPDQVERVLKKVHLRMIHPSSPKRLIRRRGYRDHGSKRPDHLWLESFDWSFTEEQNLTEQKRNEYIDLVASYVHQAGDWLLKSHLS